MTDRNKIHGVIVVNTMYLWCVFDNFSDQCGDILFDVFVWVLETRQHGRENLRFHQSVLGQRKLDAEMREIKQLLSNIFTA